MLVVLISGSSGLVGSESVNFFSKKGFDVIGIDNNLRKFFFGNEGSTDKIKNNLGFLSEFNLPRIEEAKSEMKKTNWQFLNNYKNSISNIKLNINLYYKFSNKIPLNFNWSLL